MQNNFHPCGLNVLALVGGFSLLTACPLDPSASGSDTNADPTTGTSDGLTTTTNAPTSQPPTTTDPDPTTTVGPTTDTTDTDTDPTTGTTTTTTGEVDGALCLALGGVDGVSELVAAAIDRVLVDDRINAYFLNNDVDGGNLASCLEKQLGVVAGCAGVVYDCMDMQAAHAGLGISTLDFSDFAADFALALDSHQIAHPSVTDADKEAVLTALAATSDAIIEDPASDLTIYQRVGRKPAISALVGASGEAGSFVDNVALDPAINGFFAMAEYERFNTCLTRQLGGIDGPSKYGLEVDAPAPADPGVGVGDECRTMLDAHLGMTDVNDDTGIDINDFGALVTNLVTAMTTAGIEQADQDAILAVLGPMCEDIVMPEARNDCPSSQKLEIVEATMLALVIPDEIYDGTFESMLCHELVVPDDPINFVSSVELTAAIDHNWVGDLTIKLVSPDAKVLTIVSRAGLAEVADDGGGCCGRSSNLEKAFPLTFKAGPLIDGEQLGAALNGTNLVICKDDGIDPCEWAPNPGAGPGLDFTDFHGDAAAGAWQVCFGDANKTDEGTLDAVKLTIGRVKYDPMP